MKRRLLNLLTALSLLLCVAVTALWVRSYCATDTIRVSGSRAMRIVLTRGVAVVASSSRDGYRQDLSILLGSNDRPWEPDYVEAYGVFGGGGPSGPPPGPGWVEVPFESYRGTHLGLVAAACAALPVLRLVLRRGRRRRPGVQPKVAAVRTPRGRLPTAFLGASWLLLTVAVLGWVDSATWHLQSVAWRGGVVQLISNWGRCELILFADLQDLPQGDDSFGSSGNVMRPGTLAWHREWLVPSGRAHQGPAEGRRLFTWFDGGLLRDDHGQFSPLFGGDGAAGSVSPATGLMVHIPYWSVVVFAAILPGLSLWRKRRSRARGRAGHCPACGYDLTGNVSGVCPECGERGNRWNRTRR